MHDSRACGSQLTATALAAAAQQQQQQQQQQHISSSSSSSSSSAALPRSDSVETQAASFYAGSLRVGQASGLGSSMPGSVQGQQGRLLMEPTATATVGRGPRPDQSLGGLMGSLLGSFGVRMGCAGSSGAHQGEPAALEDLSASATFCSAAQLQISSSAGAAAAPHQLPQAAKAGGIYLERGCRGARGAGGGAAGAAAREAAPGGAALQQQLAQLQVDAVVVAGPPGSEVPGAAAAAVAAAAAAAAAAGPLRQVSLVLPGPGTPGAAAEHPRISDLLAARLPGIAKGHASSDSAVSERSAASCAGSPRFGPAFEEVSSIWHAAAAHAQQQQAAAAQSWWRGFASGALLAALMVLLASLLLRLAAVPAA
jgi:hypothetical protein